MAAPALAGVAVAGLLLVWFDRLPLRFFWLLPPFGALLITGVIAYSGPGMTAIYSTLYFWVALSAFSLLGVRAGIFNLFLVGVCYAAVLLTRDANPNAATEWLMLMAAISVAGLLLGGLRGQVRRLVDELRRHQGHLSRRADQQAAVAHLGRLALAGADVDELIDRAITAIHEELDVELIEVLELGTDPSRLVLRAGTGWEERSVGNATVPASEGSGAAHVMASSEPVVIRDLRQESRFVPSELLRGHGAISGLSAAIAGPRRPIAVLGAYSRSKQTFSDDDRVFVQAVANVLGSAMARERAESMEMELRRSQRLQSVGELAGGVAHDFNNLLAVILNYADFLGDEVRGPGIGEELTEIRRAAERGADLTRQLLAFSRGGIVKHEVVDLRRALSDVEGLLRRTLPESIALRIEAPGDIWPVEIGAGQTEQVLLNLAVNARDAMLGGGTLTISLANLEFPREDQPETDLDGQFVSLTVTDTGTGMAREVAERAFDPFFTTKPAGEGTGLGLSTVYGIVKQAGGDLRLASRPGDGTTVTLLLPAALDRPASIRTAFGTRRTGADRTILLVEDDQALLRVMERVLRGNGYTVLAARDGFEARELCTSHQGPIDLLLSDVVMPGMSGPELARNVRPIRPDMARLFVSGYAGEVISRHRLDGEGEETSVLEKPFRADELLEAVAGAVARTA